MNTLLAIKENSVQYPFVEEEKLDHLDRLIKTFPNLYHYPGYFTRTQLSELFNNGYTRFVGEEFVKKMRYAAQLNGSDIKMVFHKPKVDNELYYGITKVEYIGDIPSFALDKLDFMRSIGIKKFTIHSNYKLPTRKIFEQVDPVLVGWVENPVITVGCFREQVKEMRNKQSIGVVVAAWDIDKELTFWED